METNAVIGGGIAGLSLAYHLLKNTDQSVVIFEEDEIGAKASSKAAGMITPSSEVHLGETSLLALFLDAALYYKYFVDEITHGNRNFVDYREQGSLMCAFDQDGKRDLMRLYEFQKSMGIDVRELSRFEVRQYEGAISSRVTHSLYVDNEAAVNPVALMSCLRSLLKNHPRCQIRTHEKITHLEFKSDLVDSLHTESGQDIHFDRYIVTTGLSHGIESLEMRVPMPMRSVKGQVVALKGPQGLIERPVKVMHRYPIYMVPRNNGDLVIGATSEENQDPYVTAGGVLDLLYAAWQALPDVYDFPIVETRVGHRPSTPDHKPILGKTSYKNLWVATGLYRHGIMLAPFVGKELADIMLGKLADLHWEEFSVKRFSGSQKNWKAG